MVGIYLFNYEGIHAAFRRFSYTYTNVKEDLLNILLIKNIQGSIHQLKLTVAEALQSPGLYRHAQRRKTLDQMKLQVTNAHPPKMFVSFFSKALNFPSA